MIIESARIRRMGGCLSILAMAVIAACGGGQSGSGASDASSLSVGSPPYDAVAETTSAIAAALAAVAPPGGYSTSAVNSTMPGGPQDAALALRVADAFRSSRITVGDTPGANSSSAAAMPSIAVPGSAGSASAPSTANPPHADLVVAAAAPPSSPPSAMAPPTVSVAASAAPTGGTVASWGRIATENQTFALTAPTAVRYGKGNVWVTKTVSGQVFCTNTFFGGDPILGTVKECDVPTSALALATAPTTTMTAIDTSKIPPPAAGFSAPRLKAANVADSSQVANPSDIGAFREPCGFSHMSFDDPIVFYGQPGKSHLHAFFGNTGTNANSTAASLAGSGNSTCAGGTLNRTAYWVPAMIDTRTGTPVTPSGSIFYYKTGYNGIDPKTVQPLPAGLRMVSGDPMNSQPSGPFVYGCVGLGNDYWAGQFIPNCAVGQDMLMAITFPQCWDGVNLDSPDHISHMSSPSNGKCPATHPVPVPVVAFDIHYTIKPGDAPSKWRLSSDAYDPNLPGGYSGHADWFNGWDAATMNTFVQNCEQKSLDCRAYLLGDGRTLY